MSSVNESGDSSDIVNTSYVSKKITVSTTQVEAKVGSSPLVGRQELLVFNAGRQVLYYGPTGVTIAGAGVNDGIPIRTNQVLNIQVGDGISVFLIAGASNSSVIVQELA